MLNTAVERIKELKKERNITDGMIGEIIQYHPKHFNRMLNKQSKLPEDVIIPLSEYFEVSPEYLMGHSDFKTKDEQEFHMLYKKYKLIDDLVASIKHLNLSFAPYLVWSKSETTERERIDYILEAISNDGACKEITSSTSINDLVSGKEFEIFTCTEKEPVALFLDYEKNHMGKGNFYLFHEVKHNEKRSGIISHEKFLHLIDTINNSIANTIYLTLGLISTDV